MSRSPTPLTTGNETEGGPPRGTGQTYPGTPRWVKIGAAVAVLVLVLLVLILMLAGGEHGPMRHIPVGSSDTPTIAIGL